MSHRVNLHSWEWDAFGMRSVAPSHRSTTSSRHPGVEFRGTVWKQARRVVPCTTCGQPRWDDGHPHIVTRTEACGPAESLDCQGQKVVHR